jgi:RecA-family ATPase
MAAPRASSGKTKDMAAMPENKILAAALEYAGRGWKIVPCHPETKLPALGEGWTKLASDDPATVRAWWKRWPGAMCGVLCGPESGIWALDLDVDHDKGVDGHAAFAELAAGKDLIPKTVAARSPRGGSHLLFKWQDGIRGRPAKGVPGVEARGKGNCIIMPPSMRSDGKLYEVVCDVPEVPAATPWLAELFTDKRETSDEVVSFARAAAEGRRPNGKGSGGSGEMYGRAALDDECRKVAAAAPGARNHALNAASFSLGQLVGGGALLGGETKSRLFGAATACGLIKDDGVEAVWATINSGFSAGLKQPRTAPEKPPPSLPSSSPARQERQEQAAVPLPWINMSNWDREPMPAQQWAVLNRIPLHQCVLFTGEGAAGKSTTELHRSAAHVLGRDWLGTMPEPGPAIYIDAEDPEEVLHRRLGAIVRHYGVTFDELVKNGLHLMSLAGEDAVLATVGRSGKVEPTPLYGRLLEAAGDIKPKSIAIASCANVFAGDENVRTQVQQLVGLLTRMAMVAGGSVVLVSHPSLTGISTDTGLSGSTAWHNAVRARFYIKSAKPESGEQPDEDLREIVFKKNQYGPKAETIVLRYTGGMFLPVPAAGSLERAAHEQKADNMFLTLLDRSLGQGRNVSDKKTANTYAPSRFVEEPEAKAERVTKRDLAEAMERLFRASKIRVVEYGYPSRGWTRIERRSDTP